MDTAWKSKVDIKIQYWKLMLHRYRGDQLIGRTKAIHSHNSHNSTGMVSSVLLLKYLTVMEFQMDEWTSGRGADGDAAIV